MNPITIQQVAKMAGGLLLSGDPALAVNHFHFDSRELASGGVFIAIKGDRDGHDFLGAAIAQGACAAIISDQEKLPHNLPDGFALVLVNDTLRAYQKVAEAYRNTFDIPFVAVTGSVGKTSTKDVIGHLLASKLTIYKTYKNLNNHLGVPFSLLQLENEHQAAVMELGMNHAGEIDLLASIVRPQYSVITNIGEAHLEYFGTKEKVALAKAELLPHTDPNGVVFLNGDNEYLRRVSHLYDGSIMYYSVEGTADIWAEDITSTQEGTHFTYVSTDGVRFTVSVPLFGKHNVSNCLPAIAIALRFGLTKEEIQAALASVSLSAMRFEIIKSPTGAIFINDAYNANPTSMRVAIETFAGIFPDKKRILVLGNMLELGPDSDAMHTGIGELLNVYRDRFALVITIGTEALHIHNAYAGEKQHFATKQDSAPLLSSLAVNGNAILFKASRNTLLKDFPAELSAAL
ncbi:UDP-N-acetylmuramoyl-tripeptide--D-alanyl-D-alanine ligase [Brevibacillus fluminis]|uniref:UDP-N-acetylmuramoyl-tripeptide--D-alanyl-D-alanine ligase n=1 Tax=Brevibacillus fluminis TaxID=511487 RepID=A0A3M8D2N3_9BACL|nr:UDP-N-acetylmuramoyl-tripeptide--D-alanyl-D-alanine ligase [Brevibacillus fluminis]RNB82292.1 UDP-N-acetylmuramoyl-tripeptide--D-alanyl-D-alanine ligase [Brevibacillus fluminis]